MIENDRKINAKSAVNRSLPVQSELERSFSVKTSPQILYKPGKLTMVKHSIDLS